MDTVEKEREKKWKVMVVLPPRMKALLQKEADRRNAHPTLGIVTWTRSSVARALVIQGLQ